MESMIHLFSGTGFWKGVLIIIPLLNSSCINKRLIDEEYNLAHIAFRAAKESEAKRYAPRAFSKARKYLKWGERAYKKKNYKKSTEYFKKCRYYSEKAEEISRFKLLKQGDSS